MNSLCLCVIPEGIFFEMSALLILVWSQMKNNTEKGHVSESGNFRWKGTKPGYSNWPIWLLLPQKYWLPIWLSRRFGWIQIDCTVLSTFLYFPFYILVSSTICLSRWMSVCVPGKLENLSRWRHWPGLARRRWLLSRNLLSHNTIVKLFANNFVILFVILDLL